MPAAVGAGIFFILTCIRQPPAGLESFDLTLVMVFLLFLAFGYLFVGIQSVIYSTLMEYYVNPKISNDVLVIIISGVLGALSGAVVLGSAGAVLGVVPGFVTGIYLRRSFVKAANNELKGDAITSATGARR